MNINLLYKLAFQVFSKCDTQSILFHGYAESVAIENNIDPVLFISFVRGLYEKN